MNKPQLKQAVDKKQRELALFNQAIALNICPCCGGQLTLPKPTKHKFLWWTWETSNNTSPDSPFYWVECIICNKTYEKWDG